MPDALATPASLGDLPLKTGAGTTTPLASIATITEQPAPLQITHVAQYPATTLGFDTAPGVSLGRAVDDIKQAAKDIALPASVTMTFLGAAGAYQSSLSNQLWLILAAVVCVYIVLGVLYESYIHPLTILSTLPSAGVGALLALMLSGSGLGVIGIIGIILLIGIVKKNAIMMIDFAIDAERKDGKSPEEAIHQLMKYDKQTQDVLLPLLPLVARVSAGGLDRADPQELTLVMEQLESTLAALRPRAPFLLERMCFCREIGGYGNYLPLPADYTFRPGELVEVYVEPRWFSSQRQGQHYEVRLAGLLELRDGSGQVRWRQEFADRAANRSRSPRRDLHQSFRFCVPENLRRGQYTLLLTLTDVPTRRSAQRALELHVTTRPIGNP